MGAKAEVMAAGENPRFVLPNLPAEGFRGEARQRCRAARLYEEMDCGRGERENGRKQQTLDLAADRLSPHHLGSNPLRLWLATLAYLLLERLRSVGLRGSALAQATVGTIRTRLLKVAASVTVSVRRVWGRLSSAFPLQALYWRRARSSGDSGAAIWSLGVESDI